VSKFTPSSLLTYSDGSLLDRLAGAGGVLMAVEGGEVMTLRRKRELERLQTVYVGELEGARMLLSAALPIAQNLSITTLTLSADTKCSCCPPSTHLRVLARSSVSRSTSSWRGWESTRSLSTSCLVACHCGIKGNKLADELVNEGTDKHDDAKEKEQEKREHVHGRVSGVVRVSLENKSSVESVWSEFEGEKRVETSGSWVRRRELLEVVGEGGEESADASGLVEGSKDLPKSISALKQAQRKEMMSEWGGLWQESTKGRSLAALNAQPPSAALSCHIHTLLQHHATLLFRLWLNFSDLGATKPFLPLDSPERLCEGCGAEETREHLLLECGRFREERRRFFEEVKKGGGRLEGGSNLRLAILFHPCFTYPLLRFVHSTGRFSSPFSPVIPPSPSKAPLR
jgi:hypothetical protein